MAKKKKKQAKKKKSVKKKPKKKAIKKKTSKKKTIKRKAVKKKAIKKKTKAKKAKRPVKKVRKPAKKMFDILTEKAGVKPEQIIFIDDKYFNVLGARKYGINGIHFRGEKQLMKQFDQLSLLPDSQS